MSEAAKIEPIDNKETNTEETVKITRKKILYIDDDEVSQKIISKALSKHFDVVSELSGTNAMVLADKENPNLILLDLNMPNVDGFEILTYLRNHPTLSSIPIICVSGDREENTRRRANELGASKYMPKPIDILQISNDVKNLLITLNNRISSTDNHLQIFIGYNSSEKDLTLYKDIAEEYAKGGNILILSVLDGVSFFKSLNIPNDSFELGRIVYLQIKPSLISRLPYLEEFSSVIHDIKRMLHFDLASYTLFFDGPDVLFNLNDISQSNSTLILVCNSFATKFKNVFYYTKTNQNLKQSLNINTMAKILVGNY